MLFHHREFFCRQRARLVEDRFRDRDLPGVVQDSGRLNRLELNLVLDADRHGKLRRSAERD